MHVLVLTNEWLHGSFRVVCEGRIFCHLTADRSGTRGIHVTFTLCHTDIRHNAIPGGATRFFYSPKRPDWLWGRHGLLLNGLWWLLESSGNVMTHRRAGGEVKGNWRMEWAASTLHTTSEHGVSSNTTVDANTSAASNRLNWRPRRFKWTSLFRRKTKTGFCACAITVQLASTKCAWLNHSVQAEIVFRNISEFDYLNCLQTFCLY